MRASILAAVLLAACGSGAVHAPAPPPQRPGPAAVARSLGPVEPAAAILAAARSEDGRHIAFSARRPGGVQVRVDGAVEPVFTTLHPNGVFALAARAGVAAYWATPRDRGPILVHRGVEVPLELSSPEDGALRLVPIAAPAVSPDGRRVAAWARIEDARRGVRTLLWVDGVVVGQFANVRELVGFDPSGRHVAAIVEGSLGNVTVWVDGWERSGYAQVVPGSVRWHPDGQVSFLARRGDKGVLFHRNREIELAEQGVALSPPDARGRVAYVIVAAQQQQVILDDRIVATHDQVLALDFVGEGLRVVARDGTRVRVSIVGGRELSPASAIVANQIAERDGCVLYVAALPRSGALPPEPGTEAPRAAPGAGPRAEPDPLAAFVVQESLSSGRDGCPARRWGPFDRAATPRFLPSGEVVFTARGPAPSSGGSGPSPFLQLADRRIPLGALPEGLDGAVLAEDGRIVHFAEVGGGLLRVARPAGDRRPNAELGGGAPPPPDPERAGPGVVRVEIAEIPPGTAVRAAIEPTSGRLAATLTLGSARRVVVGAAARVLTGVSGAATEGAQVGTDRVPADPAGTEDRLVPPHETLSPLEWRDGHLAYSAWDATARRTFVRRDGRLVATLDRQRTIRFGPAGSWWAEPSNDGREWSATVVGPRGDDARTIALGTAVGGRLVPSPDGRRWAARTMEGPRKLIVDGEEVARGASMTDPVWSPNAAHVGVTAIPGAANGRWAVMVDGRVVAEEPLPITLLAVGNDGVPTYGFQRAGTATLVTAGRRFGPWTNVAWPGARVDDTGRHVAVLALDRSGETLVVVDGEELRRGAREPELCGLAPGGTALAWVDRVGDADVLSIDQAVVGGASRIACASVRWSPDGARIAWVGEDRGRDRRSRWTVHVGETEYGPYDAVDGQAVLFGPSGQVVWVARQGAAWSLWVHGRKVASFDDVAAAPVWDREGAVSVLAFEGRRLVWLRHRPE